MNSLTALATEILDRCPRCGCYDERYFRVKSAQLRTRWINGREFLSVRYTCRCTGIGAPGSYNINGETVRAHQNMKENYRQKMRDKFGL